MERRHFKLIAAAIACAIAEVHAGEDAIDVVESLPSRFADALAGTNPLFDRARFLKACGVA